jgi:outer membrane receptor protein involved in Fe transport
LLTLTGRADGSSRLSPGRKWAFFPSISAGWVISDEAFLKAIPCFVPENSGWLRGRGQYVDRSVPNAGRIGAIDLCLWHRAAYGYGLSVIPNPDLRWEISKTLNIGFDFGFLNDRISGSLELYDTRTNDLLLNRLIPITSGYTSILQNIGATRNRGIELTLTEIF